GGGGRASGRGHRGGRGPGAAPPLLATHPPGGTAPAGRAAGTPSAPCACCGGIPPNVSTSSNRERLDTSCRVARTATSETRRYHAPRARADGLLPRVYASR